MGRHRAARPRGRRRTSTAALFGWTFSEATPPGVPFRYLIAQLDGHDVGGLGGPATPPRGDAYRRSVRWNTYVAVDDADAVAARVERLGGAVVAAADGGRRGWPVGRRARSRRVSSSGSGRPRRRLGAQVANVPGAWNFSDLHTDEPEAARALLRPGLRLGVRRRRLRHDDPRARLRRPPRRDGRPGHPRAAGGGKAPPGSPTPSAGSCRVAPGDEPGWHVTFTVADRDESADRAVRLGGSVVRTGDSDWTRTVVVRDPQGAVFTPASSSADPDVPVRCRPRDGSSRGRRGRRRAAPR